MAVRGGGAARQGRGGCDSSRLFFWTFTMSHAAELRKNLPQAGRIVVKMGSRVLVESSGRPHLSRIARLVDELAALHQDGREVIVVSSGAVAAGMEALGMNRRPTTLPDLQMAAAVGQSRLMAQYDEFFSARGCIIGQVLLTHADLKDRARHLNARNTMMNLLRHRIVPVVNENDVVAVDEIKFGDNDMLAALVALLTQADLLILLTTVNGLREPTETAGRTRRVSYLARVHAAELPHVGGAGSALSTGGMASKLGSAQAAADGGIPVVIGDGRKPGTIPAILAGRDVGTLIGSPAARTARLRGRKKWIAFFHRAQGDLIIDDGARRAIVEQGRSLLPIGIRDLHGDFPKGALVNVRLADGTLVARGLTDFDSAALRVIRGCKTSEIARLLGSKDYEEVIHRDNMAVSPTETGPPSDLAGD